MKVCWSRAASAHLDQIADYLARDSSAAAHRLVNVIVDRVEALTKHPYLGRAGRVADTRELVVAGTPYVVAYRVRLDQVEVLAFFHGARQWPDNFH